MKNRPPLLYAITVIIISACASEPRKAPPAKANPLVIDVPEIIPAGKETCVNMFLNSKDFRIHAAYEDCVEKTVDLDSINRKIKNCEKELVMNGDTVKVCFTPNDTGEFTSQQIRLLLSTKEGRFFAGDTTFTYTVTP